MPTSTPQRKLLLILGVLLLAALACLGGSDAPPVDTVDTSATEAALQATQNALEAQQQQQQQDPPTQPPPPPADDPPADDPPPADPAPDLSNLQSGDIIYSTDFSGPGDWEDGWVHFAIPEDNDNYTTYVENDYLYVEVEQADTTIYVVYDNIYLERDQADVRLDAFVDNVGDARDNNISLICRGSSEGWYEFSLTSSGLYFIYKYDAVDGYEILSQGGLQGYNRNDTDHELSVTCIGDELTFAINGEIPRYGVVTDRSFREGQFGVSVYTLRNNLVGVEFDYFIASVP
ncbi:MAG: hypothetical protein DWQ07_14600 [Chloroflexi bacterium]|nr:MAG: hypothetical protein DWQ07_14600 [Chloroflexota bacterium]MBL1195687.1 hypothetical protein [Chloroflexota bacterium]NOH12975.1 hypothetical protein [Chloroflexota bacterium]